MERTKEVKIKGQLHCMNMSIVGKKIQTLSLEVGEPVQFHNNGFPLKNCGPTVGAISE